MGIGRTARKKQEHNCGYYSVQSLHRFIPLQCLPFYKKHRSAHGKTVQYIVWIFFLQF